MKKLMSHLFRHLPWGHTGTNEARTTMGTTDDMFVKRGIKLRVDTEEL